MSQGSYRDEDDRGRGLEPHRATTVLILGILGLVACAPLGIAAWLMGSSDLKAMKAGRMDPSGESTTQVGYILGIIATILFVVGIAITCLLLALVPTLSLQSGPPLPIR